MNRTAIVSGLGLVTGLGIFGFVKNNIEKRWDEDNRRNQQEINKLSTSLVTKDREYELQRTELQNYSQKLEEIAIALAEKNHQIENTKGGVFIPDNSKHLVPYGLPSTENVQFFKAYVLSYDKRNKTACWSCEHLSTINQQIDNVTRAKSAFKEDKSIAEIHRAKLKDYFGSGYDRGHLTPAGDIKISQEAMDETFTLSNISPQVGNGFNRHYWARLEKFSRDLLEHYDDVYICSGPLYLPKQDEEDGHYYVRYRVIGDPPNVSVPTHFFKSILVTHPKSGTIDQGGVDDPEITRVSSFILPNEKISPRKSLDNFLVPTSELNRVSGLDLWNGAEDLKPLCVLGPNDICKLPDPDWWSKSSNADFPINETIDSFITGSEMEFRFPSDLSAQQRSLVHGEAEKRGLIHFSDGKGSNRAVVIKKAEIKELDAAVSE